MADEEITVWGNKQQKLYPAFTKRYLKFEFIGGLNGEGKEIYFTRSKSVVVEKLRATVSISYNGGVSLPECECTIYNLNKDLSNQLTQLGLYQPNSKEYGNLLIIYASTSNSDPENPTYTEIFKGGISVAYTDYASAPEVVFHVRAMALAGLNLFSADSLSFRGKGDVGGIIQSIITTYNHKLSFKKGDPLYLTLKNYVGKKTLNKANYHGDFIDQLRQCTHDAHIRFNIQNSTVYIWPMDMSLDEGMYQASSNKQQVKKKDPRLFSFKSGMIGYPAYANGGITVRSIFTGAILYGEEVMVESHYDVVSGLWKYMISMHHELSCFTPNGPWLTTIGLSKMSDTERERGGNNHA